MDTIEVLAVLRPVSQSVLTLADLSAALRIAVQMLQSKPGRLPSASVSFLEARANRLVDETGREPSFEAVLAVMHAAGYCGDVYPSPGLWRAAPTAVFARYPFASSLDQRKRRLLTAGQSEATAPRWLSALAEAAITAVWEQFDGEVTVVAMGAAIMLAAAPVGGNPGAIWHLGNCLTDFPSCRSPCALPRRITLKSSTSHCKVIRLRSVMLKRMHLFGVSGLQIQVTGTRVLLAYQIKCFSTRQKARALNKRSSFSDWV